MRQTVEFVSTQSPKKRPNPTTESGKAVLQELTDSMTDVFVAKVARNRNVSIDTVLSDFGQGGMFVGRQAIDAGLVDTLTSEAAMIADLAKQGRGYPAATGAVQSPQMKGIDMDKGFWANFFGGMFQASGTDTPQIAVRQLADGEMLESGTQPPNLAARAAITPDSAADPQVAELRAQLARMQTERITQDAQAFIQSELGAGRLLPAEQSAAAALYIRAAELDSVSIQSSGPTAVDLVKAAYAARPAHRLAANLLANTGPALVLASSADPQQASIDEDVASIRAYGEKQNKTGKR
jgi:hypothetical protein